MTSENNPEPSSADVQEQPSPEAPATAKPREEENVTKELAREFRWVEFAQIGSNVILAIVGIIAVCVYVGQLKQMRKSTEATRVAADAANESVKATREAMQADQRAWVGVSDPVRVRVAVATLGPPELRATILVSVKNFGKGPALKTMVGAGLTAEKVDDSTQSQCNLLFPFVGLKPTWPVGTSDETVYKRQRGNILFPNDPFVQQENYSMDLTSASKLKGKIAYVVGCIVYQDQFTNPHWTKFCYETPRPVQDAATFRELGVCNVDNYTDEVQKPIQLAVDAPQTPPQDYLTKFLAAWGAILATFGLGWTL